MSQKFISTIAGASIFISVIGLLSRGLGFFREMIFANNFGLGTEFDLYLVGAVLPITINSIILYIGQNYFVPGFQKLYSSDKEAAQKYYKHSFITFIGFGIIISIILFAASHIVIDLYMHQAIPESKTAAEIIFRIFLVTIPVSAAISIFSALLQAIYEFKYPAVSILFLNFSIIISLILFSDQLGVFIIPIGYVAGTILQFVYLMVKSQERVKLNLLINNRNLNLSKSLLNTSLIIVIIIESLGQLYSLFDRYFYADISSGGIAALNFASIIWLLPISIFSLSLATAVFPSITKAITDYSQEQVEKIFNENISMNMFIIIPIAFMLFFYGDIIIRLLFERGKFVEESTAITFGVLKFYSISLVFFSVYAIFNKIFYSLNDIKLLLWMTFVGLLIKLIFNFLLIGFDQNGLALSSSISYIYFSVVSYIILTVKLKINKKTLFLKDFLFQLMNCGLSFLIIRIISTKFFSMSIFYEILVLFLFFLIYLINAYLTEHGAVLITRRVLNRLNFNNLLKTKS